MDGDIDFSLGMNSVADPERVAEKAYVRGVNAVKRGGMLQCRPGFSWKFNLPSGNLQGMTVFRPTQGGAQLVFAVDGLVYASAYPYTQYRKLKGLQFSPYSERVFWCECEKTVQRNADLSITFITPRSVLMIQDGFTAPAYWDGAVSAHVAGGIAAFKTPLGTAMAWSGSRLWVARGQQVFASDIADPLSFFEGLYVGDIGAFVLPERVTAMVEVPNVQSPSLLVFTDNTTTAFQTNIRTRTLWTTTPNFQLTIFPDLGCVAPKSVIAHNGKVWWFSQFGVTSLDYAVASRQTGVMFYADGPMAISKGYLSNNLSGIAAAGIENYLLYSVPYADKYNQHTWVMDATPSPAWDAYWTGVRPVEWCGGAFNSTPRLFFVSKDHDGGNRLYEAFTSDRMDGCCPITWGFESRGYTFADTAQVKELRYTDLLLSELSGEVDVSVSWAGANKGRFSGTLTKHISAARGSISGDLPVRFDREEFAFKQQSRRVRTQDRKGSDADPLTGVEDERQNWIDTGFQLNVQISGPGAIRAVRLFAQTEAGKTAGVCEEQEVAFRGVRFDGAASAKDTLVSTIVSLQDDGTVFSSTKTVSYNRDGIEYTQSATATSRMSQAVADKQALAAAQCRASYALVAGAAPYIGGALVTVQSCPETTGTGVLNFTGFSNWSVLDGYVDLRGNGFMDALPCNGLYVDFIAKHPPAGPNNGKLRSLVPVPLVNGNVYRITVRVAGNQVTPRTSCSVDTLNIQVVAPDDTAFFSQDLVISDQTQPFQEVSFNFTAAADSDAFLTLKQTDSSGGSYGILLNSVVFENLTNRTTLIEDEFADENAPST